MFCTSTSSRPAMTIVIMAIMFSFVLLIIILANIVSAQQSSSSSTTVTNSSTTSSTTSLPPTTTTEPPAKFQRDSTLDLILLIAAGFAAVSPHVPVAAFIVSRASAISRSITPLSILQSTALNETFTCTSFGFRHGFDVDPPLFFDSPVMGWNLSQDEDSCYGFLMASLIANLSIGVGAALLIYVLNFIIQSTRFHSLPSSHLEPASNGWMSRFLLIYFYGFLLPGSVSSMLISASRCAHGFSGAIAAVVVFLSLFFCYSVVFWRKRSEVFRYRRLTFESAKKLNKLQLWILYFCEPRGIWKWIHREEPKEEDDKKKSEENQQQQQHQELKEKTTTAAKKPMANTSLSMSLSTVTSPKKTVIGAGGSSIATLVNSHPSLPNFSKNFDEFEDRRYKLSSKKNNAEDEKEEGVENNNKPSSEAASSSPEETKKRKEEEKQKRKETRKNKRKKTLRKSKKFDDYSSTGTDSSSSSDDHEMAIESAKNNKNSDKDKKKNMIRVESSSDDDEESNPVRFERNSQLRYLVALPFFDLYAGRSNSGFIVAEIATRMFMIAALVIAEAVPVEVSCYCLRGGYLLAAGFLCCFAFFRSPYAHRLVFYAVIISTACEFGVELLLLVDPFTGAEFGAYILMASSILCVMLLSFTAQIYLWIGKIRCSHGKKHFYEGVLDKSSLILLKEKITNKVSKLIVVKEKHQWRSNLSLRKDKIN